MINVELLLWFGYDPIFVGEISTESLVVFIQFAVSDGVSVSSDTVSKSFSASGFLSTAHVNLQELPTGKTALLVVVY